MTPRYLLPAALALSLCACAQSDAPSAPATADITAAAATAMASASSGVTEGSLDFAIEASTVGSNSQGDAGSVQCQLTFKASNHSQAEVKSVIAEFVIANAGDGSVIETDSTLVMPFAIPAGETREAWGPITVNDHACADLDVTVKAPMTGMCHTLDKSPCPAYRLTGEGLASAK